MVHYGSTSFNMVQYGSISFTIIQYHSILFNMAGKVSASEAAEGKAQETIKAMEGLVSEAKAKLSATLKGK